MDPNQERMVLQYKGLAEAIAVQIWHTAPHALEQSELKSIAYLGLVAAAARWEPYCYSCHDKNCKRLGIDKQCKLPEHQFDPAREEFFEPFVKRRVRGAIMDSLRAQDWATRSLRSRARQLQQAGQDQGATVAEMAAKTEMSESDVRATMTSMSQRPVSIEAEEIDAASAHTVESQASGNDLLSIVVSAIRSLEPECQVVLSLHYYQGRELQEVAVKMGITESRASRLHTDSVLAIREALLLSLEGTR